MNTKQPKVTITINAKASGKVGKWSAVLKYRNYVKELGDQTTFVADVTPDIVELFAVVEAIRALKKSCEVKVYCTSPTLLNFRKYSRWQLEGMRGANMLLDLHWLIKDHRVEFLKKA